MEIFYRQCNLKKTILCRGVFLFVVFSTSLISASLISASEVAADKFSQYGLGAESLTLPPAVSAISTTSTVSTVSTINSHIGWPSEKMSKAQKYSGKQKSSQQLNQSALQIDIEYEDKTADFFSPYHGINSDLINKLNHSSNEYQTRMGYRFKNLTSQAVFNYSPDSYGFGQYYNYELGFAVPFKDIFALETRYGWNKFTKQSKEGGMNDYQDWSVGVSTTYKGMKLKVDYIDMNASDNSQECKTMFPCEGKTVFSIIKNF